MAVSAFFLGFNDFKVRVREPGVLRKPLPTSYEYEVYWCVCTYRIISVSYDTAAPNNYNKCTWYYRSSSGTGQTNSWNTEYILNDMEADGASQGLTSYPVTGVRHVIASEWS